MSKGKPILDQNAFDFDQYNGADTELATLIQRRQNTIGPTSMLFYQEPLHIVRGQGTWLFDNKGTQYLDVYNNVPSLGHCHPKVVEAISQQLSKLNVHSRYLHDTVHIYAEKLLATMPDNIDRLVMTCTGSEANDLALRLARTHTQKQGIIVSEAAYHGNTQIVTEVSPASYKTKGPPDYVVTIPMSPLTRQGFQAGDWLAWHVRKALQTLDSRGFGCAALLVDSIFSSDGVYSHPTGFLQQSVDIVHAHGALFIADEVQPGFGRTGDCMWGFGRHQVVPDIITLGKPMGNGYPVAGLACRLDLLEALTEEYGYFNTFGGSTTAAAAGLAVLNTLEEEGLMENSQQVGAYLKEGLYTLKGQYPSIVEIRGAGLFIGLELGIDGDVNQPDVEKTTAAINLLRRDNILIGSAGKFGNVLKMRPPLCFSRDNADLLLGTLGTVLGELGS